MITGLKNTVKMNEHQWNNLSNYLVEMISNSHQIRTFGGGAKSSWGNPITAALEKQEAMFAAGVPVKQVVDTILNVIKNMPES